MAVQVVPETWAVPERFRKRLGAKAGRQRAMVDGGHLLLILHAIPKPDESTRAARIFWRSPTGEWRATDTKGSGLAALETHIDGYREYVQELDDAIDHATTAAELYRIQRATAPLLRATRNMHRALQEARDGVEDQKIISLRDVAGDIERSAELVGTDAGNALSFLEAKAAEEQTVLAKRAADAQHRLNLIAALFFPATAVGSIMGTNLHSGLENQSPILFWVVVASAFMVGLVVRGSVTRDK